MIFREGTITSIESSWPGVCDTLVTITKAPKDAELLLPDTTIRAIGYTKLIGELSQGDKVRLEASALAKSLGTGGYATITARLGDLPSDSLPDHHGHVVKARYTPSQYMVSSVDEQDSPHHQLMARQRMLQGQHVIVTDLHSAVPAIIAGIRHASPRLRVSYIYTDGGALPSWFSRICATLKQHDWITHTITCGQAFGGDIEAASLPSALIAAQQVTHADVTVVAQGPGNLGTGTPYGYSGTDAGWALTCAHQLGGSPVMALRLSASDQRDRHYGISHHTLTVLKDLTPVPVDVVLPVFGHNLDNKIGAWREKTCSGTFNMLLSQQLESLPSIHTIKKHNTFGLDKALEASPVKLSSMGRSYDQDPIPFLGAAAAGLYVGRDAIRRLRAQN
ncbi:MAG: DUF3866 family protein [Actinomycetaceae bacterium]|nr:DUF3866 family protein [Actinomycetaceae bacterium]